MATLLQSERTRRYARFLVGGGLNTAVTYAAYLLLHTFLSYQVAYFLTYLLAILFTYAYNSRFVFKTPMSWKGLSAYPLVHCVQYVLSAVLLWALVDVLGMSAIYAPLIVAAGMVPVTYLLNKLVLLRGGRGAARA
jgi:putative flippase GtrA